jgi:hypothetical protein
MNPSFVKRQHARRKERKKGGNHHLKISTCSASVRVCDFAVLTVRGTIRWTGSGVISVDSTQGKELSWEKCNVKCACIKLKRRV